MGKLIVIDGLDGCGKATQSKILYNKLVKLGKNVHMASFPDYGSKSSEAVKMYLNGEIGKDASILNPYMCSLFYTVDRAIQFSKEMYSIYNQPDSILICDRYLSANIVHQGGKISDPKEQAEFFDWIYDIETNKVGLPKDDITIILSLPVSISQDLMLKRYNLNEDMKDIHESNVKYLELCYNTVVKAVKHFSSKGYNWRMLECCDGKGGILPIDTISYLIWKEVSNVIGVV